MTQEELQLLKSLLAKAQQVLDFSENDGISVYFDSDLKEYVLYGKCSREGVYRTVSSKGTEDDYM